jgi:hypothetical protein
MDWTQTLTIILSNLGILLVLFVYLMSRMDNKFESLGSRISKIENRITALEVEIKNINQRLISMEGHLIPKKIYRIEEPSREEPKEN